VASEQSRDGMRRVQRGKGRLTRAEFDGMIGETIEILSFLELISSHLIRF
jgi:hypothetical protein